MKHQKGIARTAKADRPIIAVTEVDLAAGEDWYTPKVRGLRPLNISVTLGIKGKGRVRCEIEENGWERTCVDLRLIFEKAPVRGEHYSTCDLHSDISNEFGSGSAGTFTADEIDRLILALTTARDQAASFSLFTPRHVPRLVAGGQ